MPNRYNLFFVILQINQYYYPHSHIILSQTISYLFFTFTNILCCMERENINFIIKIARDIADRLKV